MTRNPLKRVVRFDTRPNDGPATHLWPTCSTAVLECGHHVNLGVGEDYRPQRMACRVCGADGEARNTIVRWDGF